MKIQHLAVIFVIIILPISIVLSEFIQVQIDTLNLQTSYNSKLLGATYDAVVAFQKNTINATTSDISQTKIRDVEASANTFMNSIANNFKLSGNAKQAIQAYIPAVVYTLYDGYYIYSKYNNYFGVTAGDEYWEQNKEAETGGQTEYSEGQNTIGLKPYITYSRQYTYGTDSDFVITYSLDNYITIQGKVNGKIVNKSGYLLDNVEVRDDNVKYRDHQIPEENDLYEYIDRETVEKACNTGNYNDNDKYRYVKVAGTKYYLNEKLKQHNEDVEENLNYIFYFGDDQIRITKGKNFEDEYFGKTAQKYYREAAEFTNWVRNNLGELQSSASKYWDTLPNEDGTGIKDTQANYDIFKYHNLKSIEEPDSDFNQERRAVIKYSIEKNLATAIANYNKISTLTADFQMPNLQEDEWDKLLTNPSVISFLQGMNIGNKIYNGYAIVTNNKNLEAVSEDSIYITTGGDNGEYHKVTEKDLVIDPSSKGYFNIDFERKKINYDENIKYYNSRGQSASYNSIVRQSNVEPLTKIVAGKEVEGSIYDYLDGKEDLAKIYYTALGRERYGLYKSSDENQSIE